MTQIQFHQQTPTAPLHLSNFPATEWRLVTHSSSEVEKRRRWMISSEINDSCIERQMTESKGDWGRNNSKHVHEQKRGIVIINTESALEEEHSLPLLIRWGMQIPNTDSPIQRITPSSHSPPHVQQNKKCSCDSSGSTVSELRTIDLHFYHCCSTSVQQPFNAPTTQRLEWGREMVEEEES